MTGLSIPATIVVPDSDVIAARADLGDGFFIRGLSETGEVPPTHWMTSGYFFSEEMDRIFDPKTTWEKQVRFGVDWQAAIDSMGLRLADESVAEDAGVAEIA